MLKLRLYTLQKCTKVHTTTCSTPKTSSSLSIASLISFIINGCKGGGRSSKSVIWKPHQKTAVVLLDDLCNNNLIVYEQSKKRVTGLDVNTDEHYNKRIRALQDTKDYKLGLGRAYDKIKDDLIMWKHDIWLAMCNFFGIEGCGREVFKSQLCFLEVPQVQPDRFHASETAGSCSMQNQDPAYNAKNPFLAPVLVNRELHKGGDRSCLHIELDIKGSKMQYEAGDHVAMYPTNDMDLVERLCKLCQADLNPVFSLINSDSDSNKKLEFPCATTYRTVLTHYLEITAKPTTRILKKLAEYCTDEADKEFLLSMTSITPDGKEKYQSWIENSCRNIVHILEDIKSCKPPIEHICELLPRLQPRYYSISSSSKLYPTNVHITAVIVQYKTSTGRINKGVATAFLKQKQNFSGQVKVPIFIRKSQFRLPTKPETPIIMVGRGTGLAPFRGFIQERQFLRDEGKVVGDTVLYFGCRKKSEDFIYKEELEEYVAKGTLTLKTAFSRDQKNKIYVTHLMEQDADLLWKVIGENKGIIYICGDANNLGVDVKDILVKILSTKGSMSKADAVKYLEEMETQKRYVADVWS